ncbi:hypothetical protein PMAA_037670 [Talaromyces marneffei ATCC 18224]|uniref:Uncharacterized protein n=1 Tax=Talaromyces marneffei (strain ATCC 18224 / CBS 334.59 / QM 7333) TaxID=441960 RepID=B6Q2B3_TALMQ|nr:hypothetical protein PMAA_037670 [Talaromyces marneffei ATCC 18224]
MDAYIDHFREVQRSFQFQDLQSAFEARKSWVKNMNGMRDTLRIALIEDQIFLINHNLQALIDLQLGKVKGCEPPVGTDGDADNGPGGDMNGKVLKRGPEIQIQRECVTELEDNKIFKHKIGLRVQELERDLGVGKNINLLKPATEDYDKSIVRSPAAVMTTGWSCGGPYYGFSHALFDTSTPTTAQQTPSQHAATTTPEYPPAVSPVHRPNIGRTEPLFASQRLSTPMSASNPATIEYPPIGSTVRDSVSERPASTTTSIPPRPSSSSASTQPTTSHSPPETQSHTTRGEEACCLRCAKSVYNEDSHCRPHPAERESRCFRCVAAKTACKPIPAEHLPGFRAVLQLFREGKMHAAFVAHDALIESLAATTPLTRIERQLFLLNRNVERLLNWHLNAYGLPSTRLIEEEFPED